MSIDLGGGKSIHSMTLIDLDTGEEHPLNEREGSRCFFNDSIYLKDHIITLRIDWGDIRNTDPVLDADIYRNNLGNRGKKLKNGPWHHTLKQSEIDGDQKIYDVSFKNLRLRLIARMTCSASISASGLIVENENGKTEDK